MNRIVRQALTAAVVDGMVGVVPASAVAGPIPKTVLSVTGSGDKLLPGLHHPSVSPALAPDRQLRLLKAGLTVWLREPVQRLKRSVPRRRRPPGPRSHDHVG